MTEFNPGGAASLNAAVKMRYEANADTNAFTDAEKAAVATNTAKTTNATHTGDVTGSGALTIAADAVTNAKAANMGANTLKGNNTGSTADPLDLTATQATAMLDAVTSGAKGLAPASGGGTTNFLRADGTWAAPAGGGTDFSAFTASIVPNVTGTISLGSGTKAWATLYADAINLGGTTLTASSLADPNADRVLFWDDSAGTMEWLTLGTNLSITGTTLNASGAGLADGDKGDITVSSGGATWTIDNAVVTLAKMADMATASLIGRNTAGTGVPEVLTGAQVLAITGAAALATAQVFTKSQGVTPVAVTDAATIATDASLSNIFTVTLTGNQTLGAPSNMVAGKCYTWIITQDGTGTRTLAYNAAFKFPGGTAGVLSTATGSVDILSGVAISSSVIYVNLQKAFA